ncbi:cylicin-2-like [Macadamia integrifolia]|uniref:cylicin-2-like n=1 Tax=Macadamia integrifolia TaxID=60698 RepID=UPI001C4F76E4|nr:cylicin-2-like [Macadamia integrifolia]
MDFNQRVDNDKASTYFASASASASGDGYFTEQALRVGYISSDMVKNDPLRNPTNVGASIQREIEKERIREEIMAEERRALEIEVRRELLLEKELMLLALQRRAQSHGLSLMASSASMLRADQRLSMVIHPEGGSRLDESFAALPIRAEVGMHQAEGAKLEERLSLPLPSEVGVVEKLPLQRTSEPRVGDVKPPSDVGKGQVLFFAKPTSSILAGMKRKVVEPQSAIAIAGLLPSAGSKKKPQEWSCALCQVSATSEKGLNDHVQGRKHKSKEAALLASKTISKNTGGSTSSTKGTDKPTKTANTTNNPKKGKKQEGNKQQPVKQAGDAPVQKKQKTEGLKNAGMSPVQKKQKPEALKRKFKFWCEMCQVGTHGRAVMASHQKGRKHVSLLEKLKKENGSIPGTNTSSESTHDKPKNVDTEAKEANGETEKLDGEVEGVVEADTKEAGNAKEDESADKNEAGDAKEDESADKKEAGDAKEDESADKKEAGDPKEDESADKKEAGDAKEDESAEGDMDGSGPSCVSSQL